MPAERLSEVGERLGVSAERVRQIEERALAKLRNAAWGCAPGGGAYLHPGKQTAGAVERGSDAGRGT